MRCNVGTIDRIIRAIIGILIVAAGFYFSSWWGIIGVIPLLTAAIGWCPLYVPIALSTCKAKS